MSDINYEATFRSPDTNFFLTPLDPYNDTVLQFRVLEKMGYPVALQEIDRQELPEELFQEDKIFQKWLRYYPRWVRPIATNPDFDRWIELPSDPGDIIDAGEVLDEFIFNHPMTLASAVDRCDVNMLAYHLELYELEGELPLMIPHDEGLLTKELIEKCLIAAFERNRERWASENDYPVDAYDIPDQAAINLYNQLKAEGKTAVSPEELMALIYDYYSLVERLVPEFAAFKQTGTTNV